MDPVILPVRKISLFSQLGDRPVHRRKKKVKRLQYFWRKFQIFYRKRTLNPLSQKYNFFHRATLLRRNM